jgi:arylsulfatase A-like enzyme
LLILVLALLAVGAGVWIATRGTFGKSPIRHVILISLDTTRADYFSCLGYPRPTTPNMDALAEQGYLFTYTMSPIPFTLPAHTSMLTGTIPPYHGKHDNNTAYFDPEQETLATILRANGYYTGAFVGAQVLNRRFGLDRGFDEYYDQMQGAQRKAEEVNQDAFDWLSRQLPGEPVFMFIHYYDAHDEYNAPEPFGSAFKDVPYAGEIAYTDYCVGQVVEKLKQLDMYDSSLIIVTGDHGEMLGEHGELTHTYFIYQSALHVPMIFKLPESVDQTKIDDVTSIVDIVPTVCDLLGLEPPKVVHGKNLAGYFRGDPPLPEDRYLYCESFQPVFYGANSLLGLVGRQWKYIHTTVPELYDLQSDPGELKNLVEADPRRAAILMENLTQISNDATRKVGPQDSGQVHPDLVKHLQTLGYTSEPATPEEVKFDERKENPKDLIGVHNQLRRIEHLVEDYRLTEALELIEEAVQQRPYSFFYHLGAMVCIKREEYKRAIAYAEKAVELDPQSYADREQLARAYAFDLQDDKAAEQYEETLKILDAGESEHKAFKARVHFQLGMTRNRLRKHDLAIVSFEESLKLNPKQPLALDGLAVALIDSSEPSRDLARALQVAQLACSSTEMKYPNLLQTLARANAAMDHLDEAIAITTRALSLATAAGDQPMVEALQEQLNQFKQKQSPGSR